MDSSPRIHSFSIRLHNNYVLSQIAHSKRWFVPRIPSHFALVDSAARIHRFARIILSRSFTPVNSLTTIGKQTLIYIQYVALKTVVMRYLLGAQTIDDDTRAHWYFHKILYVLWNWNSLRWFFEVTIHTCRLFGRQMKVFEHKYLKQLSVTEVYIVMRSRTRSIFKNINLHGDI